MATDAEIRAKGFLYIPKQKYLQNPFNLPIAPVPPPVSGGITNTNAFVNSGGGEDNTQYNNSLLPDLPQFNYVDMVRKYGADSKQAQQMLEKAGGTYPGGFQSNEGGFQYTNSFPDTSVQMQDLNYQPQGYNRMSGYLDENFQDGVGTGSPSTNFKGVSIAPSFATDGVTTVKGNLNKIANPGIFDSYGASVEDPQVGDVGFENYSESAFEETEEENKQSFIANMISRAKQVGSDLPGWAKAAATVIGGPFAAAASFLGNAGGSKGYEQFDPRGNIKGGVYTMDGVNYANPGQVNESYDNDPSSPTYGTNRFDRATPGSFASFRTLSDYLSRNKDTKKDTKKDISSKTTSKTTTTNNDNGGNGGNGGGGGGGFNSDNNTGYDGGNFCFDPSTPIQMADGSTKEIKNIQLGDDTKGGEVTGVFQFKATDEIHDYKGVTVAGSHYVKEDGRFIMVKDSPLSVKIDKIPVVYSLDTSGRRIFIKDIEFADYNGDGVAKNFLTNAGVDLSGFDKEVLRQVENRLL
jgi:hypothetical protein